MARLHENPDRRHRSLIPIVATAAAAASMALLLLRQASSAEAAVLTAAGAQEKMADMILAFVSVIFNMVLMVFNMVMTLLPGFAIASLGFYVYTRWGTMTRKSWAGVGGAVFLLAVFWAVNVRINAAARAVPAPDVPHVLEPEESGPVVGSVHSGEEVQLADGTWTRLPDPTKKSPTPRQGWQQGLATAMTDAIRKGEEQVVLVFSRQGCPWCDRQLPVLRRAILRRKGGDVDLEDNAELPVAFVGGSAVMPPPSMGGNLLFAPLRVFILDAGEFPTLAQEFKVEAFPTSLIFGSPGVTPMMGRGYLDDNTFDEVLRGMATQVPEMEGAAPQPRRRRRLFR